MLGLPPRWTQHTHWASGARVPPPPPPSPPVWYSATSGWLGSPPVHVVVPAAPTGAKPTEWQRHFGERDVDDIPFGVGSVFGCRWWTFEGRGLQGTFRAWKPGVNEAECIAVDSHTDALAKAMLGMPYGSPTHDAPARRCACGYYAFWAGDYERYRVSASSLAIDIFGVVEGYGRVMRGDWGFRCGKARVVAACVMPSPQDSYDWSPISRGDSGVIGRAIEDTYGIPVYASRSEMLTRHPLTAPPAITEEAA